MFQIIVFKSSGLSEVYYLSSWYCKPVILQALAFRFHEIDDSVIFISCRKYGCRQFLPVKSDSFPIGDVSFVNCNSRVCNRIRIEFGDYDSFNMFAKD